MASSLKYNSISLSSPGCLGSIKSTVSNMELYSVKLVNSLSTVLNIPLSLYFSSISFPHSKIVILESSESIPITPIVFIPFVVDFLKSPKTLATTFAYKSIAFTFNLKVFPSSINASILSLEQATTRTSHFPVPSFLF